VVIQVWNFENLQGEQSVAFLCLNDKADDSELLLDGEQDINLVSVHKRRIALKKEK